MDEKENIIELLRQAEKDAVDTGKRGLIIQPGALGDCILTLPLADAMKRNLRLGTVAMMGRAEYLEFLPGRSCVDKIRSIDTVQIHRLFADCSNFTPEDNDRLICDFAGYDWIFSFLGDPGSDFEKNLIFTANCSNAVEASVLRFAPVPGNSVHISEDYLHQLKNMIADFDFVFDRTKQYINPLPNDIAFGKELLKNIGASFNRPIVLIHPGSGGRHKCWHIANFLELANNLKRKNFDVVFVLGPAEGRYGITASQLNGEMIIENLSTTHLLGVVAATDVFIGNDSGPAHLAGAMGKPCVAIFCDTEPLVYAPLGAKSRCLRFNRRQFAKPSSEAVKTCIKTIEAAELIKS